MDRQQLIEQIKGDEGWRPHVYIDTEGYQTIGYGFLVDERRGGGMPREVGEFWLARNVDGIIHDLTRRLSWFADQPEAVQMALCNMAYQLGTAGLLQFERMLSALKSGDRATAAEEALNSRWAEQTPNRAERVARMLAVD